MAEHTGIGAKTATHDKADGFDGEIDLWLRSPQIYVWGESGLVA